MNINPKKKMLTACFIHFSNVVSDGLLFEIENRVRGLYAFHGVTEFYLVGKDDFMVICDKAIRNAQKDFPQIRRIYEYCPYDDSGEDKWEEPEAYFDYVDQSFRINDEKLEDQPLKRQMVLIDQCDCCIFYANRPLKADIKNTVHVHFKYKVPQTLYWYACDKGKEVMQL